MGDQVLNIMNALPYLSGFSEFKHGTLPSKPTYGLGLATSVLEFYFIFLSKEPKTYRLEELVP